MWSSHRAADLPVVAVVVVDPEQLHQGNDTKTTMEQMVEQQTCRRSSPENRDYSPMDAGLDLQGHDGKAQPWQRDGFSGSR